MNTCPVCDGDLPPLRHQGQARKWCSEICRQWARRHPGQKRRQQRSCVICAAGLGDRQYQARVCSLKCRRRLDVLRATERWETIPPDPRACAWCMAPFRSRSSATKCCSLSCAQRLRQSRPRPPEELSASLEKAKQRWQAKNRRRRAAKHGQPSEPYTLGEIAERDGHRCQLCHRRVDMRLKARHPMSPTIDHVIPISDGGDDTRANVQLAHFGCNSSKGAGGSQQLALIG